MTEEPTGPVPWLQKLAVCINCYLWLLNDISSNIPLSWNELFLFLQFRTSVSEVRHNRQPQQKKIWFEFFTSYECGDYYRRGYNAVRVGRKVVMFLKKFMSPSSR